MATNRINRYGSRYNINHPAVNRWYRAFLTGSLGHPEHIGCSDRERREFESIMDVLYEKDKLPDGVFNRMVQEP